MSVGWWVWGGFEEDIPFFFIEREKEMNVNGCQGSVG